MTATIGDLARSWKADAHLNVVILARVERSW
jgi:hypothetical protein